MKILVTGGAGFIGSHIVEHFTNAGAQVRVLDNLRSGFKANIEKFNVDFIEGSITDGKILKKAVENIDYVFHLAAMISVPESMLKPNECVEINTQGTLNVLRACADAGVKKLVFSSSAAIYGDNPTIPKKETMFPEPKSPYAVTKLDGEYYCKMFDTEGWLKTACLRYFNVFGPRQNPKSQYAAAVPIFVYKAIHNEEIVIFGDGQQTRDFIYVKDIANANAFLATHDNCNGVYNCANGRSITIKDLAEKIIRITGSKSKISYAPPRAGDVKHSVADTQNINSIGCKMMTDFDTGLANTIEFFKKA
jgi:UDP-glucose 4-epimerase